MQKARGHPVLRRRLPPLVSARFQLLFTPLVAVVFNVQSPYFFAIGRRGVLRLGGWTPHVQSGFPEPEFTLVLTGFRLQGFHLLGQAFNLFVRLPVYPFSLAATHGVAFAFLSCSD
jgi:hypothetical protein